MRFHPHTAADIEAMLKSVGVADIGQLFRSIPKNLQLGRPLEIPAAASEEDILVELEQLATRPKLASFLGAGVYHHYMPSAVDSILRRSEFLTSYTPYQPEIAQGTLQAIFEFQTMVSELFGLPIANASMYDGASALAEAVLMSLRLKPERKRLLFARSVHPDYRESCHTYLSAQDISVEALPFGSDGQISKDALQAHLGTDVAAVVVQSPNFFGTIEDLQTLSDVVHAAGALLIVSVTEPLALGLLEAPGKLGADIVVGEGLGMVGGPQFGGPGVGLFATKEEFLRNLPGRICGQAQDKDGQNGYVLTLSTREQHIRREKATSNICTNQGLIALAFAIHLALRGPHGLRELAEQNLSAARGLERALDKKGIKKVFSGPYFNELVVHVPSAKERLAKAAGQGVVAGFLLERRYPELKDAVLLWGSEQHEQRDVERLVEVLS